MRKQFLVGYAISALFIVWSIVRSNYEFIIYAITTLVLLGAIHYFDRIFNFNKWALWGFDLWMLFHIFGGLFSPNGRTLYNWVIIPIVSEPYSILKYDQVVHIYCYFIAALLMWSVVSKLENHHKFGIAAFVTVMAATGVGGLNEIIEFSTTVFFSTNVGGYENTAIDIVSNLIGSLLAVPFFRKI